MQNMLFPNNVCISFETSIIPKSHTKKYNKKQKNAKKMLAINGGTRIIISFFGKNQ